MEGMISAPPPSRQAVADPPRAEVERDSRRVAERLRAHRWLLALLVAYTLSVLPVAYLTPLANSAEERCWSVSREMLATGDWLVPHHEGAVRLQKPPLAYWTGAAASKLLGCPSLWALRLPSILAGIGLIALVYAWGRSAGGERLGLSAAATLAVMESVVAHGQRGTAEMQLALLATLALVLFQRLLGRDSLALRAAFALALALALLAKATAAVLVVGLPVAIGVAMAGHWWSALRPSSLVWLLASAVPLAAWYTILLLRVPEAGATLREIALLPMGLRTPGSSVGATHYESGTFYLCQLPLAAAPAIVLLPWAVQRGRATRLWRGLPAQRFATVALASQFAAFILLPQKQKHYMLPLLPFLALLLADGALVASAAPAFARRTRMLGQMAGALVLCLTTVAVGIHVQDGRSSHALVVGGIDSCLGVGLLVVARRDRPAHLAGACIVAALAMFTIHRLLHEPLSSGRL
jgi:4-amino-4-deoxy-L-arabinose transferase-like glycosyltransferase